MIDPEFAFYGPAGYDVGNIVANLVFAWVNADTTIPETKARSNFTGWLEDTICSVMKQFVAKWRMEWQEHVAETVARYEGFADWYLSRILRGPHRSHRVLSCPGASSASRTFRDLTSISGQAERLRAERYSPDVREAVHHGTRRPQVR